MLLADKIGEIRGQTLTALNASHDFYSHTKNVLACSPFSDPYVMRV